LFSFGENSVANSVKIKLVAAFLALSFCATSAVFTHAAAHGNDHNSLTLYIFVADSHIHGHYDKLADVWKPRIGGNWIAGRLCDAFAENGDLDMPVYQNVFAFYHTAWLLLIFGVLIFCADNPVFVIPLVYAGMTYILTPPDNVIITPWDLPSMFFWTISYLLWQRKHYLPMLAVIVLGTAFKETVAVTAFLFFFTTLSWRRRWTLFGAAFVACVLLKLWISYAVYGEVRIFTADTRTHFGFQVFKDFFDPHINHFIWVNGGTFIIALCLPMKTLIERGTKFILVVFLLGMTAACILAATIYESRQFLDVLPISVLYLGQTIQRWQNNNAVSQSQPKTT
jgi:hypothetical protein